MHAPRRSEIIIIVISLCFACFGAGYFTGRSANVSAGPIEPVVLTETQPPAQTSDASDGADGESGKQTSSAGDRTTESDADSAPSGTDNEAPEPAGNEAGAEGAAEPAGPININTASVELLCTLPGIGDTLAERIVAYREANGPFTSLEALMNVSGIGEKRFAALEGLITVGE